MDVERIQKINNLALDLMKQGLAQDREEAIAQAEKIFRHRDTEDYNFIKEQMESTSSQQERSNTQEDLSQDQIKDILEKNTNFIVKKIKEFEEKIESMKKEMKELRNKVDYHNIPTVKELLQEAKKHPEAQQQQITSTPEKKEEVPSDHPRSGNYNDNDVSIEKFFYMGSK